MGNDNKVKIRGELVSKSMFLPEEIQDYDKSAAVYSLEGEFEKTRKNKNLKAYILIAGFIGAIVVFMIFLSAYNRNKSRDVKLDIKEFEDSRLKDLIDAAKKKETRYDAIMREVNELQLAMQNALLAVKDKYRAKRDEYLSKNQGVDESTEGMKNLDLAEEKEDAKVRADFEAKIRAKERELATAAKSEKDSNVSDYIDNKGKLQSLEMKTLRAKHREEIESLKRFNKKYIDSLILRYNPKINQGQTASIVNSPSYIAMKKGGYVNYASFVRKEGVYSANDNNRLRQRMIDHKILMNRMMSIPYENSVPPMLRQIDNLSQSIFNDLIDESVSYRYAIEQMLKSRPESGYIIDARNPGAVYVHVNNAFNLKPGTVAYVFRDEDEFIGTISLYRKNDMIKAKILEIANGKSLMPFDKILFQIKAEQ